MLQSFICYAPFPVFSSGICCRHLPPTFHFLHTKWVSHLRYLISMLVPSWTFVESHCSSSQSIFWHCFISLCLCSGYLLCTFDFAEKSLWSGPLTPNPVDLASICHTRNPHATGIQGCQEISWIVPTINCSVLWKFISLFASIVLSVLSCDHGNHSCCHCCTR